MLPKGNQQENNDDGENNNEEEFEGVSKSLNLYALIESVSIFLLYIKIYSFANNFRDTHW